MYDSEEFDNLWQFAEDSTEAVSLLASKLAAEKAQSGWRLPGNILWQAKADRAAGIYLGRLAVNLRETNGFLKQPVRLEDFGEKGEKLERLLAELERMCDWSKEEEDSSRTQSSHGAEHDRFPTLHGLLARSTPVETAARCLDAYASATASTSALASRNYFSNLAEYLKSTREVVAQAEVRKPLGQLEDEYPQDVNRHLYDALSRHASCACKDRRGLAASKAHGGRLRLEGKIPKSDDGACSVIRAIFSASGADGGIRWQQLEFRVSSAKRGLKSVKIGNESKQSSQQQSITHQIATGQFCEVLNLHRGDAVRLCLRIQGGWLHYPHVATESDQSIQQRPSIPLTQVLETHRLTNKMKVVLAYVLARSAWQFYSSDWMKTRWLTDSIHFMPEHDDGSEHGALFACKPCFAFQFDEIDQDFTEYVRDCFVLHRYPRILALGILLVEIGKKTSTAQPRNQGQNVHEKINNDWTTGKNALQSKSWPAFDPPPCPSLRAKFQLDVVQPYRDVVAHCFDEKVHKIAAEDAADQLVIMKKRKKLAELVVFPLKNVLDKLRWTEALEHIDPIPPAVPSLVGSQRLAIDHSSIKNQNRVKLGPQNKGCFFFDSKSPGKDADVHADEWLRNFHDNVFPLLPKEPKAENRVKIAILDTGIDKNDNFLLLPKNAKRIQKTQSFLGPGTGVDDKHGHGTHTVALLLRIAPNADVFVARVAEMDGSNDSIDPKSVENAIKEAIKWGANIITMSFGFPKWTEDVDGIKTAIKAASGADILMFCAASNGGVDGDISFPANQNEVICVNSANGQGTPSGFNPGEAKEGQNICALGEDVKSSWPKHLKVEQWSPRKSGTSFATPIAAALAAVVLDYARDKMLYSDKFQIDKLKTKKGMLTLFQSLMSAKTKDYVVLKPGQLFEEANAANIYGNIYSVMVKV